MHYLVTLLALLLVLTMPEEGWRVQQQLLP